jgi:hypothetical protein
MKKPYPIKILFVLLIVGSLCSFVLARTFKEYKWNTTGQTKQPSQGKAGLVHKLTVQDRKRYLLKIDQQKIRKPRDTVFFIKTKRKFFNVPVILVNFSNDTLKYLTMSCSWEDFFSINDKKLTFWGWPCDSNFPKDKVLLPHKSATYNIPVILTNSYVKGDKFRIGMNLFIVDKRNERYIFDFSPNFDRTINLIWSNEVEVP